ncbi:MAG: nucleoside triphosphate pyrophosphatase [Chloroflexota bacterium]|nr:Maf family protein [Dehalococcoidia bacterium]MDW8253095.1 nucleoside triphosphate pyrophosphatase [Chloroflexota bacterium]
MMRLLLLSASPRRRDLLAASGLSFEVCPVAIDETPRPGESPAQLAERLAREKAAVAPVRDAWGIAADTVVALEGEVFGKPATPEEAVAMLRRLRGRWHEVYTAVAVRRPDGVLLSAVDRTRVLMRSYSDQEIAAYVASGDPLDKAGAYAIQHPGFRPVERIEGRYDTVVGLPVPLVMQLLDAAGWPLRSAASPQ